MIASMTGYGCAETALDDYKIVVEISSVNNRYLDMQIRTPKTLMELEQKIKKLLSAKVKRGKVFFSLVIENTIQAAGRLSLDTEIADMYHNVLTDLKARYNLSEKIGIEHFITLPDLITAKTADVDMEKIWADVEPVCSQAIEHLYRMRLAEGKNLHADFINRLNKLTEYVNSIKEIAAANISAYREKLKQKIQEVLNDYPVDEQRIAQEAAIITEKMDITEEITRLHSHFDSYRQALNQDGAVGKRLSFILQEMNREANTIASKAADYQISLLAINIKDELEKLREQVLNIE
ncbi:MAG: YicC family protein [candidate division Zixibacteria bacterium]|nr:YicC family protein [candidate division Zixibacteria bacterium]